MISVSLCLSCFFTLWFFWEQQQDTRNHLRLYCLHLGLSWPQARQRGLLKSLLELRPSRARATTASSPGSGHAALQPIPTAPTYMHLHRRIHMSGNFAVAHVVSLSSGIFLTCSSPVWREGTLLARCDGDWHRWHSRWCCNALTGIGRLLVVGFCCCSNSAANWATTSNDTDVLSWAPVSSFHTVRWTVQLKM